MAERLSFFRKIKRYLRRRKLYAIAKADARAMCSSQIGMLPPDLYLRCSKEELLVETQRALHECRIKYDAEYARENAGKTAEEKLKEYIEGFMGE